MNLELTDTQRTIRDTVRRFAREQLDAAGIETDRTRRFPTEIIKQLAALGMLGILIPERYGGGGADHLSLALVIEEIAVECAATAAIISTHSSLASWPIVTFGSDAQRRKFLPKMASGESLGCCTPSERGPRNEQLIRAVKDGASYVINGSANFIINAPQAGVAILFVSIDRGREADEIAPIALETRTPGWRIARVDEKMGIHGAQSAQVALRDVRATAEQLIGAEGDGREIAISAMSAGRIGIAAQAVGIARASLEAALSYAVERRTFGNPIASYQAIQWKLADMAVEIDAARLLTHGAAAQKDADQPCSRQAAMAKLFASEAAMHAAIDAVQIHGGYGYTQEFQVERYFRDAKMTEIAEGTSEIQRLTIADLVAEAR